MFQTFQETRTGSTLPRRLREKTFRLLRGKNKKYDISTFMRQAQKWGTTREVVEVLTI